MCGCSTPKQCFIAMTCDSKSHTIIWFVVSVKLNICKKKNRLRNNDIESRKNIACFPTDRTDV